MISVPSAEPAKPEGARLGRYPTPVERLVALDRAATLWLKRDDLTHPEYGGNKVRKLEYVLPEARRRSAKRILTVGAVGSHHVLATAFFAGRAGFAVDAVLAPQPRTPAAGDIVRAGLAHGMTPHPTGSMSEAMISVLARALAEDAFLVPIGGSGILGTLGYVDAGRELAEQVARGELPNPDVVIVTCGSGGTVAGIALGLAAAGLETRVLGVCVSDPVIVVRALIEWLISRTANVVAGSEMSASKLASEARRRLSFTTKFLGRGYAYPTESSARALAVAAEAGLTLDPTYTAKTFAAVLEALDAGGSKNVLYWHTLSAAPLEPLLVGAPTEVPPRLAKLLR